MAFEGIAQWLQNTLLAQFIAGSAWAFPAIETVHVIAIALVVGSISIVDLRLLDVSWKTHRVTDLTQEILPWTWGFFIVAVITGLLMFISDAASYALNFAFQIKLLLMALAGANMLVFHMLIEPGIASWDVNKSTPASARIAAGLSLTFWIGVVAYGRWIAFTTTDNFGPL